MTNEKWQQFLDCVSFLAGFALAKDEKLQGMVSVVMEAMPDLQKMAVISLSGETPRKALYRRARVEEQP